MATKGIKFTQEHKNKIGKANKELCGKGNIKYWLGKKRPNIKGNFKKGHIPKNKSGHFNRCTICSKEFWVRPRDFNKKFCSNKCRGTGMIGIKSGSFHWNWKGGISTKQDKDRHNIEMVLWRKSCLERDNYTCQKTKIRGGNLQVHHINNFSQFPELRTSIENGITLSEKSHKEFHKKYGKQNNTKEQLEEFLQDNLII